MRQLRRWKRLWRRSLTRSHKRTFKRPSGSCWTVQQVHCSRRRLLWRGLEFHVCTINNRHHTKKVWKLIVCSLHSLFRAEKSLLLAAFLDNLVDESLVISKTLLRKSFSIFLFYDVERYFISLGVTICYQHFNCFSAKRKTSMAFSTTFYFLSFGSIRSGESFENNDSVRGCTLHWQNVRVLLQAKSVNERILVSSLLRQNWLKTNEAKMRFEAKYQRQKERFKKASAGPR